MITLQQIKNFLNPFKGATASSNGIKGLVPTPKIGDENKFLQGSGIWEEVDLSSLENDIINLQNNKANILADNINVANYLTKLGFTGFNKSESGYYKMPNDLIIQWGITANLSRTAITITFPISFPTFCLGVYLQCYTSSPPAESEMTVTFKNQTSFGGYGATYGGGSMNKPALYFAIGY